MCVCVCVCVCVCNRSWYTVEISDTYHLIYIRTTYGKTHPSSLSTIDEVSFQSPLLKTKWVSYNVISRYVCSQGILQCRDSTYLVLKVALLINIYTV